jgi:hypothetical protein
LPRWQNEPCLQSRCRITGRFNFVIDLEVCPLGRIVAVCTDFAVNFEILTLGSGITISTDFAVDFEVLALGGCVTACANLTVDFEVFSFIRGIAIGTDLIVYFEVVALGGGGINLDANFIIRFKIYTKSANSGVCCSMIKPRRTKWCGHC